MKYKIIVPIALLAVFAGTYSIISQAPVTRNASNESSYRPIGYDPVTLVAVYPDDGSVDLNTLNTPKLIEGRKLDLLAGTKPAEYFRQFPKSEAQLKAEAESRARVLHPWTLAHKRARQTAQENLADDAAIAAILNPGEKEGGLSGQDRPPLPPTYPGK